MAFTIMKYLAMAKPMKMIAEISIVVLCVLFLILPNQYIPSFFSGSIDSTLGMVGLFLIGVVLFTYMHIGVVLVYVVFAYDLIRRSASINISKTYPMLSFTPSENKRDTEMRKMNSNALVAQDNSLEEEVIAKMAPTNGSQQIPYMETAFKPISEDVHSASLL